MSSAEPSPAVAALSLPPPESLAAVLLVTEIATYEWDVSGHRVRGDDNLARLFGLELGPDGCVASEVFSSRIHPEDLPRLVEAVRGCIASGENFEVDFRTAAVAGHRWLNSRGQGVKGPSGEITRLRGVVMDVTARKRAEQECALMADRLRRLSAIHETLLSGIPDFAYVFDRAGRFLYANRALLRFYGRTAEQVIGRTFGELGYPDWLADQHQREIARVVATRKPLQGEVPVRGGSGISGVYNYIFTPILGADGEVEAVAGTTRDVTGNKRAEARDRLLVALDDATRTLTEPLAITQAAARFLGEYLGADRCAYADVEADEDTFNLTGDFNRDVPSIVGRYRFDQFGPECLRLMRAGEAFVVSDSETDPRTTGVRESYRATLIRSVICVPLRKSGRFVAAMAVHQAIPREWRQEEVETVQLVASRCWESIERARVVRVLAESEQRLRLAVATGRLGIWELDLPGRHLAISDQGRAIHGRGPGAYFSFQDLLEAVHREDRSRVESILDGAIDQCTEFEFEYRIRHEHDALHWILVRGQCSRGPDGRPLRLVGVMLDITARKAAEDEQVRLREEAVLALRAKDDFLAALSHELRTPLNPILLIASDSATDPTLPTSARTAFETIRRNVELEARLIDDLLDLTSITRGKITLRPVHCDLHDIINDALTAVQPYFNDNQVRLNVSFQPEPLIVHVDEVRIAQVMMNVLKNAAKFTLRGGEVRVSTDHRDGRALIEVVDTGIGMTPGELDRAFMPFEQGEHARTPGLQQFGGLGLGLSISWRLITLHGGEIRAESAGRHRGTTVTVTLPLAVAAPVAGGPAGAVPANGARGSAKPARILVVEDHAETRAALVMLLGRRGYRVTGAASVAEALDLADREQFDLLISDLGLPDGDGTTLMTQLHSLHGLNGIALTGFGMEEDVKRCRNAGFAHHLTKPISLPRLEAALRDVLSGNNGHS